MDSETEREPSSDIDCQISSLSLDTSEPDTANKTKRKGTGRSAKSTWVHSRPAFPHETQNHKYCSHCKEPNVYHTTVSSNMRSHLKSRHGITVEPTPSAIQEEVNKQLEQLYLQAETSNQTEEVDTRVLRKVLDSDRIHEAFVSLLVTANLPFRLVELPQFHAYNQCLNPEAAGSVTTSHSHVATKVGQVWEKGGKLYRKKFNQHCPIFIFRLISGPLRTTFFFSQFVRISSIARIS